MRSAAAACSRLTPYRPAAGCVGWRRQFRPRISCGAANEPSGSTSAANLYLPRSTWGPINMSCPGTGARETVMLPDTLDIALPRPASFAVVHVAYCCCVILVRSDARSGWRRRTRVLVQLRAVATRGGAMSQDGAQANGLATRALSGLARALSSANGLVNGAVAGPYKPQNILVSP